MVADNESGKSIMDQARTCSGTFLPKRQVCYCVLLFFLRKYQYHPLIHHHAFGICCCLVHALFFGSFLNNVLLY
jgi:hypothetical protein